MDIALEINEFDRIKFLFVIVKLNDLKQKIL